MRKYLSIIILVGILLGLVFTIFLQHRELIDLKDDVKELKSALKEAREERDHFYGKFIEEKDKPKVEDLGYYKVTYYCPCEKCSEGWGKKTKSGKIAQANHTVAADLSLLPLGSSIIIGGQRYMVEDIGGAVRGRTIDIYVPDCTGYESSKEKVYLEV